MCSEDQHIVSWKIMMPWCKSIMKCPFIMNTGSHSQPKLRRLKICLNFQLLKFNSSYILLRNHWFYLWNKPFPEQNNYQRCIWMHDHFKFPIFMNTFKIFSNCRLPWPYDLISHIICIMIFAIYAGGLDKHFDGSFVTVCWKMMILGLFMFPLPYNSAQKYTRVDPSSRTDIYP